MSNAIPSAGPSSGAAASSAATSGPSTSAVASAAADREHKMLEAASESLLQRIGEVKGSIASLIAKLETDPHLNWPSFLDSYALLSGQLNSLVKNVKNDRTPELKKYICLPLALSPDRDEELLKMSEGRVAAFSHDLVPDYLRTKPDPEVEQKHSHYETKASTTNSDTAQKQLNVMEKVTRELLKVISREKEDLENKANSRLEVEKTCAIEDTYALVAAISTGKGLKSMHPAMTTMGMRPGGIGGPLNPNPQQPGVMVAGAMGTGGIGKAPSAIKTNIKGASQVHPYARQ